MARKQMVCCSPVNNTGCCCNPCWGLVIVIIGIVYLLIDYGIITWFRLSWWTTAFLLIGIYMVCCAQKKVC
jgi:hypothetical protein